MGLSDRQRWRTANVKYASAMAQTCCLGELSLYVTSDRYSLLNSNGVHRLLPHLTNLHGNSTMISRSDYYYWLYPREETRFAYQDAVDCGHAGHASYEPICLLLRLPNELLEQIALGLRPSSRLHVLEGTGYLFFPRDHKKIQQGDIPEMKSYMHEMSSLHNLALTCSI